MKKLFTMMLLLISVISIAMAQPAMMTKGKNDSNKIQMSAFDTMDTLQVEIVTNIGYHFPNDSSLICPIEWCDFYTNEGFSWYQWETSLDSDNFYISEDQTTFTGNIITNCYIKVTVGDDLGNVGFDSIYFNVKDWITLDPMSTEIVEIGNELLAKVSFLPNTDNTEMEAWITNNHVNWDYLGSYVLYPGINEHMIFYNHNYNQDTVWDILIAIYDSCWFRYDNEIPGMYIWTETDNGSYYLNIKTNISANGNEYIYPVFTVDSNGTKHPYMVNNQQLVLPAGTEKYQLTDSHENEYYQCAVAKMDETVMQILSYSNKVENPWITNLIEYDELNFNIYPNPAQGQTSIVGDGAISIKNLLGQTVINKKIDGETTVTLPSGVWFVHFCPNINYNNNKKNKKFVYKLIIQ